MSRKLTDLTAAYRPQVTQLLETCKGAGVEMRPYFTLRTPAEQAKLWRQSRATAEVKGKIAMLKSKGAPFLAGVLDGVGPCQGRKVTNALPGTSWHQWGEAVDCYWLLAGAAEWSSRRRIQLSGGEEVNGYHVYARIAEELGLTPGGHWSRFKDWPHVQLSKEGSPRRIYSWPEIDERMKAKFG